MTALFVLGIIMIALGLDWGVRRIRGSSAPAEPAMPAWENADELSMEDGYFLSPTHTWLRVQPDGSVRIGVDAFARNAIGEPATFTLPAPGDRLEKDGVALTAVRDGRSLNLRSPVAGIVRGVNPAPAQTGASDWLLSVEPVRLGAEIKKLLLAEEARSFIGAELTRFREFLVDGFKADPAMATLPDGGMPAEGVLALLPEETWLDFEDEFLTADAD